jgi:hypothetical protein
LCLPHGTYAASKRLCASRGERCAKLHESVESDAFPVSWHDSRQGVHSTNTDRQLVCSITCSDRQRLSGRQSILLHLLQTICKNCPGVGVSRCFFERCAQTLAAKLQLRTRLTWVTWICNLCSRSSSLPPAVGVAIAYHMQAVTRWRVNWSQSPKLTDQLGRLYQLVKIDCAFPVKVSTLVVPCVAQERCPWRGEVGVLVSGINLCDHALAQCCTAFEEASIVGCGNIESH